ncbi:18219_t:CDS:2, partial [Acaulospora morrowiae]
MTSEQKYPGYEELSSYLTQSKNKSFWGFLLRCRDAIIATTLADSRWKDLDDKWATNFITEARTLVTYKRMTITNEQINSERQRYNFEDYWNNVISERRIKEDILVREAEEARIQGELSLLRRQLFEIQ